jgi:hypothetical protein
MLKPQLSTIAAPIAAGTHDAATHAIGADERILEAAVEDDHVDRDEHPRTRVRYHASRRLPRRPIGDPMWSSVKG